MIVEIALSLENPGATDGRRKREGDIIEARPPSLGVGLLEMSRYVWGRIDVTPSVAAVLLEGSGVYKRRYYVPLTQLRQAWNAAGGGTVDVARLLDLTDPYQPCLPLDPATGLFLSPNTALVLNGSGLIFDHLTGKAAVF